ncbi:unnamed protein product [Mesocestoides corti]|uniref:COPIIcoated_ERV domain-containing protein n=1 Tax=Mesocestoides corti TaxID=53468 RepID=A0A0R3UB67_MESCO|nr:unnamed protein product [Mesocestoides corti]
MEISCGNINTNHRVTLSYKSILFGNEQDVKQVSRITMKSFDDAFKGFVVASSTVTATFSSHYFQNQRDAHATGLVGLLDYHRRLQTHPHGQKAVGASCNVIGYLCGGVTRLRSKISHAMLATAGKPAAKSSPYYSA